MTNEATKNSLDFAASPGHALKARVSSANTAHAADARLLAALEKDHLPAGAFRRLSQSYWANGKLSSREKHLIAVAIAQVTRCEYCIEHHSLLARDDGATLAELLAAAYVTGALETLGTSALTVAADLSLTIRDTVLADSPIARSREVFVNRVLLDPALSLPFRGTLAAAVAYAKEKEAWRAAFHDRALESGAEPGALEEAYAVAVIIRAGGVYAHTLGIAAAFSD